MISYFELIERIFGEEDFQKLLDGEPIDTEEDVDVSPGSGFHHRIRKHKHDEKEATAK